METPNHYRKVEHGHVAAAEGFDCCTETVGGQIASGLRCAYVDRAEYLCFHLQ